MDQPDLEKPIPIALLTADLAYQDRTGKWIIAGTFNSILASRFPAKQHQMVVFFQLTQISKPVDLHLRIENASTGDLLLNVGGPIKAKSPLEVVTRALELRGFEFPAPGKYWVQLVSGEEILIQAPLHLRLFELSPAEKPKDEQG